MLIRFVRMTFQEDKTEEFQEIFDSSKDKIRAVQGCCHLDLMRDINQPNIYMTHRFLRVIMICYHTGFKH